MTKLDLQRSNLNKKLENIHPDGGTAMRDSIVTGIEMVIKLEQLLKELGIAQNYNFVNVVITDG